MPGCTGWKTLADRLPGVALAVRASGPAAGPTLTFLELLLGSADAALSGHLSLGILDPANELVSGQGCDVVPSVQRLGVGDQRLTQVGRHLVHHPPGTRWLLIRAPR